MKILHAANLTAGVPTVLARGQRALGHTAHSLAYIRHPFGYPSDLPIPNWRRGHWLMRLPTLLRTVAELVPRYDVFHLNASLTLLPYMLDLPLLRSLGKTVVVHFHGCEVRQAGLTRDGTFWIENGQIKRPLKNFRFNQEILTFLANAEAWTAPVRVSAGLAVPAIKAANFHFASGSDAV